MDIAPREPVEKELDVMIERRSRKRDPDEESDLWRESVERYDTHRREENRIAWCDYFERLAAGLRCSAEEYDLRARALQEDRGEGVR